MDSKCTAVIQRSLTSKLVCVAPLINLHQYPPVAYVFLSLSGFYLHLVIKTEGAFLKKLKIKNSSSYIYLHFLNFCSLIHMDCNVLLGLLWAIKLLVSSVRKWLICDHIMLFLTY